MVSSGTMEYITLNFSYLKWNCDISFRSFNYRSAWDCAISTTDDRASTGNYKKLLTHYNAFRISTIPVRAITQSFDL
jgi:hypothetical protein